MINSKKNSIIVNTDVFYYTTPKCELKKIKDCQILNEFVFKRNSFFLTKKGYGYMVCMSKDGELYSVWSKYDKEHNQSEILSEFRNGFLDKNITEEMAKLFMTEPLKYYKKYLKAKKKKS